MIALDLLRTGAVTVAAAPALFLLRRAPGRVRHAAFAAALAASAAAPFAVGLVPQRIVDATPTLPRLGRAPSGVPGVQKEASAPVPSPNPSSSSPNPPQIPDWFILLPGLIPLGRMALGWRTARRWAKNAAPGPDGTLLSSEAVVPMTFFDGRRNRILLPTEATQWPEERLRAVLLHERAHIHRGDWWTQTAARFVIAAQWMNPLAWWMLRNLVDAAEASADQATLRAGVAPQAYARELLTLALPGLRPVGTLPMTPQTDLGRRVVSVLKGSRPGSPWALGAAALLPLALVLPAASIGCSSAIARPMRPQSTEFRRQATEEMFGNAANGWTAGFPGGQTAKLEYVLGWFKGTPLAWKPDGTLIPLKGLPIGPIRPADAYVFDAKKKAYVKSGKLVAEERMFVVSFNDPTGVMEAGVQSATAPDGPARKTFGRGSWTTDSGKPGKRYTASFIAYSDGYGDIKGKPVYKDAVGFARGPLDAKTVLTYDEKKGVVMDTSPLGGSTSQQQGFGLQEVRSEKALDLVVNMKQVDRDFLKHPWLVGVARRKDGSVETQGPALLYEGPKAIAHPYYRYSFEKPRSAYSSIEVLAGATEVTEFREVALMPHMALQSEQARTTSVTLSRLRGRLETLQREMEKSTKDGRKKEAMWAQFARLTVQAEIERMEAIQETQLKKATP